MGYRVHLRLRFAYLGGLGAREVAWAAAVRSSGSGRNDSRLDFTAFVCISRAAQAPYKVCVRVSAVSNYRERNTRMQ